jgi:hypothetical protein
VLARSHLDDRPYTMKSVRGHFHIQYFTYSFVDEIRDVIAVYSSGEGQYRCSSLCLVLVITSLPQAQEEAIGIESREVVTLGVPGAHSPSPANLLRLSPF